MEPRINYLIQRLLYTSCSLNKKIPTNIKGKSASSQKWITRQLNDPYVVKAKMMNYRCRSAFKLLQIDDRFNFLKPGCIVIDCGAAPGSWTQVSVQRTLGDQDYKSNKGLVIAVDKQHIYPIKGAIILGNSDFTQKEVQDKVLNILDNSKADVVLSDMAPNATGIKDLDNENILKLCYTALRFAIQVSKVDATFLVKLWQCNDLKVLENDISQFYKDVKITKPTASHNDSAEIFILARYFKGLLKQD